jgi:hypothetical protein
VLMSAYAVKNDTGKVWPTLTLLRIRRSSMRLMKFQANISSHATSVCVASLLLDMPARLHNHPCCRASLLRTPCSIVIARERICCLWQDSLYSFGMYIKSHIILKIISTNASSHPSNILQGPKPGPVPVGATTSPLTPS